MLIVKLAGDFLQTHSTPLTLFWHFSSFFHWVSSARIFPATCPCILGHFWARTYRHLSGITFRYENQWLTAKHKQSRAGQPLITVPHLTLVNHFNPLFTPYKYVLEGVSAPNTLSLGAK